MWLLFLDCIDKLSIVCHKDTFASFSGDKTVKSSIEKVCERQFPSSEPSITKIMLLPKQGDDGNHKLLLQKIIFNSIVTRALSKLKSCSIFNFNMILDDHRLLSKSATVASNIAAENGTNKYTAQILISCVIFCLKTMLRLKIELKREHLRIRFRQ